MNDTSGADGYAIGNGAGDSLQIGDGDPLTPVGEESKFFTLGAWCHRWHWSQLLGVSSIPFLKSSYSTSYVIHHFCMF